MCITVGELSPLQVHSQPDVGRPSRRIGEAEAERAVEWGERAEVDAVEAR